MKKEADEAAAAAAQQRALQFIAAIRKDEESAAKHREGRDAAIHDMHRAGKSIPEIHRALEIPLSTVRHSIQSAIIRSSTR